MKLCVFHQGACVECGAPQINVRQQCGVFCGDDALPPGLGDMVAAGLDAVGITKARAQAVAQAVGLADCGCEQRQQLLNDLGRRVGIGMTPATSTAAEIPEK